MIMMSDMFRKWCCAFFASITWLFGAFNGLACIMTIKKAVFIFNIPFSILLKMSTQQNAVKIFYFYNMSVYFIICDIFHHTLFK